MFIVVLYQVRGNGRGIARRHDFEAGTQVLRYPSGIGMKSQEVETRVETMPLGRCKATWKREFKLPWREAGPPNHHDVEVDSDQ